MMHKNTIKRKQKGEIFSTIISKARKKPRMNEEEIVPL